LDGPLLAPSTPHQHQNTANVFTGTETLEFEDSTATEWSENSLPSGVCIEGELDFTTTSNPPGLC